MCDLADAIERKGRNEGMITMLIQLLKKKVGNLKDETIELIETSSKQNIDILLNNFMNIDSEEEIYRLLMNS